MLWCWFVSGAWTEMRLHDSCWAEKTKIAKCCHETVAAARRLCGEKFDVGGTSERICETSV